MHTFFFAQQAVFCFDLLGSDRKVDVDECALGTARCHKNAICQNMNAVANTSKQYECTCPPGLFGDGIDTCDLPR